MDAELVARKAAQAARALSRVKLRLPASADALRRDFDAQDTVYRNIVIAVQNCVDIGTHLIADNGWESPAKMGAVFEILADHRRISGVFARELRGLVTLRNIIVYDYTRIDLEKAFPLLKSSLLLVPRFCKAIMSKRK